MGALAERLGARAREYEYRARHASEKAELADERGDVHEAFEERLAGVAFLAVAVTLRELAETLDDVGTPLQAA